MKVVKIKIYVLLIFSLFVTLCILYYQHYRINKLTNEKEIYQSNTCALLSSIELYQLDSVLMAGNVQILNININEYERCRAEDAELIKRLNIKIKRLESASKTLIAVDAPVVSHIVDSVYIYKDTSAYRIQKVEMNNDYIHFNGIIRNDSLKANINIPITLNQFVYYTPKHKFLWWKWGIGTVKQIVSTDNPYVNIKYTEFIKIDKR